MRVAAATGICTIPFYVCLRRDDTFLSFPWPRVCPLSLLPSSSSSFPALLRAVSTCAHLALTMEHTIAYKYIRSVFLGASLSSFLGPIIFPLFLIARLLRPFPIWPPRRVAVKAHRCCNVSRVHRRAGAEKEWDSCGKIRWKCARDEISL